MKTLDNFHIYQHRMHHHILNNDFCALFVEMGLGKTITTLTAINDLLDWCEISKPLIVAPRLVAEKTWSDEITEWQHVNHLRISKIIGNPKQREKAITAEGDVWIISRDNLPWLVDLLGKLWNFDMVILDESTSFKSHSSLRFKKMEKAMEYGAIKRLVELTGTPAPNGLLDLWAPLYLLDKGERLGTKMEGYRNRFFVKNEYKHRYEIRPGGAESIQEKIKDICISMRKEDWLDLKPVENVTRKVELPNMAAYKKFQEDAVLALEEGEITAVNAGVLYGKLLQFCNGAVYDEWKDWHLIHGAKLDMLDEIVEALNGEPVIIFYCFKSDVERITERIKGARVLTGSKDVSSEIDAWNRGETSILLAHPASAGHGLNLQHGGRRIIWFGLPSSLELYQQAVARLDRQGQVESVINMHLTTQGTIEETVATRLIDKTLTQDTLIDALKAFTADAEAYRKKRAALVEDDWLNS